MNDPEKTQEIIIIKRNYEGEEGHHGGAWKIAFADFMTAMMALFLVLWLINAANEETKKAVASYFNPVKLVERNRSIKGMHDSEGSEDVEKKSPNEKFEDKEGGIDKEADAAVSDSEFFSSPLTALDVIAQGQAEGQMANVAEDGGRDGDAQIDSASGGTEFTDPFSPNFWVEQVDAPEGEGGDGAEGGSAETAEDGEPLGTNSQDITIAGVQPAESTEINPSVVGPMPQNVGIAAEEAPEGADNQPAEVDQNGPLENGVNEEQPIMNESVDASKTAAAAGPASTPADEMEAQDGTEQSPAEAAAEDLRQEIQEQLAAAFGEDADFSREISVTAQDEAVLISLTDNLDISMFGLGSAVPSRNLVLALERIGGVLDEQSGAVRIHGHTDARPFSSDDYDNWRLSAARAQSAYYMLLRGGLGEERVREISGFADRQLLFPDEPLSPKNRRIEVLVEVAS